MFSASGIASGLDTNSLVRQLISIERQPITKLQAKRSAISTQVSDLGKFSSQLKELEDMMSEISTSASLLASKVSSSDEEVVNATSTGDAVQGSWEVEVTQLARKERNSSSSYGTAQDEVREGTLTIEVFGEDAVDVTIGAGATLEEVRDAINASGAQVSASILNTGSGSQLQITSLKEGYDPTAGGEGGLLDPNDPLGLLDPLFDIGNAVKLTESYTGVTGQSLGMTQTQEARNAEFSVDGNDMVATSNSVSDVIQGLTLDLKEVTTEPVQIEVEGDNEQVTENIKGLVNKYNDLRKTIDKIGKNDASFARNANRALSQAFSGAESSSSDTYVNLSSLGIKTDYNTGNLTVDETKLSDALSSEPSAITSLFLDDTDGVMTRLQGVVDEYTTSFDGLIALSKETLNSRSDTITDQIDRLELRIDAKEERMRAQFTAMETFISEMNNLSMRVAGFLPSY